MNTINKTLAMKFIDSRKKCVKKYKLKLETRI